MKMDYRDLLQKYIDHIIAIEGTAFLNSNDRGKGDFSDEEWAELRNILEIP